MKHVLPNILTIFRIVVTPLIVWLLLGFDNFWLHLLAFFLFLIASLTDLFDGMLARKLKVVSEFGKFMDPLADKILVNDSPNRHRSSRRGSRSRPAPSTEH